MHKWYYWNYNKTPVAGWDQLTTAIARGSNNAGSGSVNGSTCIIDHTAAIFNDNRAKIKVTAHRTDATSIELTSVYDEFEILKLYDGPIGAPGEKSVAIIVSNEDQMIPCDGNGNPAPDVTTAFSLASTTVEVLEGNNNITTNDASTGYAITATPNGVTSTNGIQYDSTNHRYTYKVDGWANNNSSSQGYVTFTATRTNYPTLTKVMSLTKIQTGEDGKTPTVYDLSITPNRVTTDSNGNTTSKITLTASVIAHTVNVNTSEMINTDVSTSSSDVMYYQWFINGSTSPVTAASGTGPNGKNVYTISKGTQISSVVCKIRKVNSSGVQLDSQSVSFTPKGNPGETGATGDGAITLSFPQSTDTIGLNSSGYLTSDYSITLPFTVYQGSTPLSGSVVDRTDPLYSMDLNGASITPTWGTNSITLTIAANTRLYNSSNANHSLNGQFVFPIDYTATSTDASGVTSNVTGTVLGTFSWNLDIAPSSISVDTANSWIRYKRTQNATQPTITLDDTDSKDSIAAAQNGGTKPYYIWCCNHVTYSDGSHSETYTVNYYPADPTNGKSVQTTTNKQYACVTASGSNAGINPPSSGWNSSKTTAIGSTAKPYYVWERNVISYKYSDNTSAGPDTTTYSVSYYPADMYELALNANSTIFNGSINTITITPVINCNNSPYTISNNGTEIVWSYTVRGNMENITSTTTTDNIYRVDNSSTHSLVVKADAVNGGTSIRCSFTKDGRTYYEYLPLEDYTDEFRCELYSTVGDKLTNGQGSGFIECLLYRNGYEIDKITAGPTVTSARVATGASPHAAVISTTTEMNASSKPSNISDISTIVYSWTYKTINSSGNLIPLDDSTYNASGKAIYIDGTMVDKKIMISCEVTITYA